MTSFSWNKVIAKGVLKLISKTLKNINHCNNLLVKRNKNISVSNNNTVNIFAQYSYFSPSNFDYYSLCGHSLLNNAIFAGVNDVYARPTL